MAVLEGFDWFNGHLSNPPSSEAVSLIIDGRRIEVVLLVFFKEVASMKTRFEDPAFS
jgi:hypothetical protein